MTEAFIYDAIRTPRGRGKNTGSLHEVKPVSLLTGLLEELPKRNPSLDSNAVDDVILGVVSPVGDQGADIARTAVLASGFGEQVAGVQLNRFCASGIRATSNPFRASCTSSAGAKPPKAASFRLARLITPLL